MYIYIYIHTYIYIYIHTYVHIYAYIYTYIFAYSYGTHQALDIAIHTILKTRNRTFWVSNVRSTCWNSLRLIQYSIVLAGVFATKSMLTCVIAYTYIYIERERERYCDCSDCIYREIL